MFNKSITFVASCTRVSILLQDKKEKPRTFQFGKQYFIFQNSYCMPTESFRKILSHKNVRP